MPNIFKADKGLIPALDCNGRDELIRAIETTKDMDGVVSYKLGSLPLLSIGGGFCSIMETIRERTDLPIIYDHQKLFFASSEYDNVFDIPPLIAHDMKKAEIGVGIILGLGNNAENSWYKEHLKAFIEAFLEHDIIPIVVAHMTSKKYLIREGGLIPDDVPEISYRLAADLGVEYFMIPGNKPRDCKNYLDMLSGITEPKFIRPGFGKQGGNEEDVLHITKGRPAYMIIGPMDKIDYSEMGEYASLMK